MLIKHFNKTIGELRQDRVFITHRTTAHLFRRFGNGLGLSYSVIKKLKDLNCWKIIFLLHFQKRGYIGGTCPICNEPYSETEMLMTTPDYFLEKGNLWEDANNDYQRILPLDKLRQKEISQEIKFKKVQKGSQNGSQKGSI